MATAPALKRDLARALASEKKLRAKARAAMSGHAAAKRKLAAAARKAARAIIPHAPKPRYPGSRATYEPSDQVEISLATGEGMWSYPELARRHQETQAKISDISHRSRGAAMSGEMGQYKLLQSAQRSAEKEGTHRAALMLRAKKRGNAAKFTIRKDAAGGLYRILRDGKPMHHTAKTLAAARKLLIGIRK